MGMTEQEAFQTALEKIMGQIHPLSDENRRLLHDLASVSGRPALRFLPRGGNKTETSLVYALAESSHRDARYILHVSGSNETARILRGVLLHHQKSYRGVEILRLRGRPQELLIRWSRQTHTVLIEFLGINASIRGKSRLIRSENRRIRPQCVIVDDPWSDDSLKSPVLFQNTLKQLKSLLNIFGRHQDMPRKYLALMTVDEPHLRRQIINSLKVEWLQWK